MCSFRWNLQHVRGTWPIALGPCGSHIQRLGGETLLLIHSHTCHPNFTRCFHIKNCQDPGSWMEEKRVATRTQLTEMPMDMLIRYDIGIDIDIYIHRYIDIDIYRYRYIHSYIYIYRHGSICIHVPSWRSLGAVSDKDPPTAFPRMESAPVTPCKGHLSKRQSRPCLGENGNQMAEVGFFNRFFGVSQKKSKFAEGPPIFLGNYNSNMHLPPQIGISSLYVLLLLLFLMDPIFWPYICCMYIQHIYLSPRHEKLLFPFG